MTRTGLLLVGRAGLAVGFAVAQELMKQSNLTTGGTPATPPPVPGASAVQPNPDILDPATVARILGVSETDVMEEITSGNLTAKKIGSTYRVTRAALDAFLAH